MTRERVILHMGQLYPGQTFSFPLMRQWEQNLAKSGIFKVDPENGGFERARP